MTAPDLAAYGIHLNRPRVGWQGTACPECARTKRRPRDGALGVEIFADGGARWFCQRCGFKGTMPGPRRSPTRFSPQCKIFCGRSSRNRPRAGSRPRRRGPGASAGR
jgi:hypothetical protein